MIVPRHADNVNFIPYFVKTERYSYASLYWGDSFFLFLMMTGSNGGEMSEKTMGGPCEHINFIGKAIVVEVKKAPDDEYNGACIRGQPPLHSKGNCKRRLPAGEFCFSGH
jgi:hypothetical protein